MVDSVCPPGPGIHSSAQILPVSSGMDTGPWRQPRLSALSPFLDLCLVMFLCRLSRLMSSLRLFFCLSFLLSLGWSVGGNYLLCRFQKWNFWVISYYLAFSVFSQYCASIYLMTMGELRHRQRADRCDAGTGDFYTASLATVLCTIPKSQSCGHWGAFRSLIRDCPLGLWR